ncbi:MAG: hypothetical protein QME81_06350, partial [bacterium]|nr:hypothetical protein [bacterium]
GEAANVAESFQKVVTGILGRQDLGYHTLSPTLAASPLLLRLFLTTGKSFKKRLTEREMGHPTVDDIYRNLPLPHFIWICEISHRDLYLKQKIWGEILWDATRNAYEPDGWIALHYPEMLVVDIGSTLNMPRELASFDLEDSTPYAVYRNNLEEIIQ